MATLNARQYRVALEDILVDVRREGVTASVTERLSTLVEIPLVAARLLVGSVAPRHC